MGFSLILICYGRGTIQGKFPLFINSTYTFVAISNVDFKENCSSRETQKRGGGEGTAQYIINKLERYL